MGQTMKGERQDSQSWSNSPEYEQLVDSAEEFTDYLREEQPLRAIQELSNVMDNWEDFWETAENHSPYFHYKEESGEASVPDRYVVNGDGKTGFFHATQHGPSNFVPEKGTKESWSEEWIEGAIEHLEGHYD